MAVAEPLFLLFFNKLYILLISKNGVLSAGKGELFSLKGERGAFQLERGKGCFSA